MKVKTKQQCAAALAEELADACAAMSLRAVKELLNRGANPNGFMNSEGAPLSEAINAGSVEVVRLLLRSGADANLRGPFNGKTPLALACSQGRVKIAEMLVSSGADVNLGEALSFSVSYDQPASVKFLLKQGAKVGPTLLHRALRMENCLEMAGPLIESGADVNQPTSDSVVPLHLTGNNPTLTKLLLSAGANPNLQHRVSKNTPLFSAAKHGNLEVVQMLLEAGADPKHLNAEGKLAEQVAKKHGHLELAKVLRDSEGASAPKWGKQLRKPQVERRSSDRVRKMSEVKPPKISIPKLGAAALKFKTGLGEFISLVDEFGGAFGLIAVESPIEKVVAAYHNQHPNREVRFAIKIRPSKRDDAVSTRWLPIVQPTGCPWTVIYSQVWFNLDGVDEKAQIEAKELSKKLRARALVLLANSDGAVARLFDKGEVAGVNAAGDVDKFEGLLEGLQLYLPACHAIEHEAGGLEVVCLAVRPPSKGRVSAAASVRSTD